jgi:pimeloyl-ACP methyl ester carboxylesterase
MFFHSPANYMQCYLVNYVAGNARLENFWNKSILPLMNRITLPTLILWGAHDGATPVQMAYDAYAALGTPEKDKRITVFPNAAHTPDMQDPVAFERAVRDFIQTYRD